MSEEMIKQAKLEGRRECLIETIGLLMIFHHEMERQGAHNASTTLRSIINMIAADCPSPMLLAMLHRERENYEQILARGQEVIQQVTNERKAEREEIFLKVKDEVSQILGRPLDEHEIKLGIVTVEEALEVLEDGPVPFEAFTPLGCSGLIIAAPMTPEQRAQVDEVVIRLMSNEETTAATPPAQDNPFQAILDMLNANKQPN